MVGMTPARSSAAAPRTLALREEARRGAARTCLSTGVMPTSRPPRNAHRDRSAALYDRRRPSPRALPAGRLRATSKPLIRAGFDTGDVINGGRGRSALITFWAKNLRSC